MVKVPSKKRFEIDEGTKGILIYDNEGPDDYYFINDKEELESFVELINELNDDKLEQGKKMGFLKRDLYFLINLIKDTPMEDNYDYKRIRERWV